MYIKSAEITNIRSIENFKIEFENPAGWHVLIGDNGSGKSTIIRSIALALVGPDEAQGLPDNWANWLSRTASSGSISLTLEQHPIDKFLSNVEVFVDGSIYNNLFFSTQNHNVVLNGSLDSTTQLYQQSRTNWSNSEGWFSVAYGPYRRFTGGDANMSPIFEAKPKLGAHLSAFSESVALTEPIKWLKDLNYEELEFVMEGITIGEQNTEYYKERYSVLDNVKKLVNSPDFLPNHTKLESVSSKGVFFKDGNENLITIDQLSDGYRSILSLTLELIRQLIRIYGAGLVFQNIVNGNKDKIYIDLPGVVLIDEIDAHLHPTWQTKIGQWFLKYFPNLQFIVTTHSPLVCRAAEKGTIWKLAAPGSGEKSEQVTGIDRDRLIYGNVLDAYGTEEFGIVDNTKAVHKKEELVRLSKKQTAGKISKEEESKLHQLRAIFSTDATIEL